MVTGSIYPPSSDCAMFDLTNTLAFAGNRDNWWLFELHTGIIRMG